MKKTKVKKADLDDEMDNLRYKILTMQNQEQQKTQNSDLPYDTTIQEQQNKEEKCEHGYVAHYFGLNLCAYDGIDKRESLLDYGITPPPPQNTRGWEL